MSATAARLRLRSGRLSGLTESRLAVGAFALLALFALVHLYRKGYETTFYYDEWGFVLGRHGGGIATFLEPHNEHFSLVPVVIYKLLFATAGLDHYAPYRMVLLVLHVVTASLLFAFARPRAGNALALGAAALLLFLGAGFEDILWPFQIGFVAALACGLGALLLLDRDTRGADVGAMVLLVLGIASASIGIPIALGAAVYIVWRPSGWRRLWVVAVPLFLYALWYLGYGKSSIKRENFTAAPSYTADEVAGSVSAVAGLSIDWGRALGVAAAGGLVWHLSRVRVISRSFAMVLVAALSFWVLTALARADLNEPTASRYLYPGGLFVLLIAVEALRGWRPSRFAFGVVAVGVLFAVVAGLGTFHDGANGLRFTDRIVRAEITPLEIGAGAMPASFQPDTEKAPQISAGPYLDAVRDIGSSPAYTEEELAGIDDGRRALADGVFVRGYGLTLAADTAAAQGLTSCVRPRPVAGGVGVTIPPGGMSLRAPGAQVTLRRFASNFSLPPLTGDPSNAVLRIPRDRSDRPWYALVQHATGRVRACETGP